MAELTTEDTIIAAALDLAGARGWDAVTMTEIAAAAEVPLAETARLFPDKGAVLDGLGRMVDAAMLAGGPFGLLIWNQYLLASSIPGDS